MWVEMDLVRSDIRFSAPFSLGFQINLLGINSFLNN